MVATAIRDRMEDAIARYYATLQSQHVNPRLLAYKSSPTPVEASKGNTLEGYCAVWKGADGQPYIDEYKDETVSGSWRQTISRMEAERRNTGRTFLIPHLYQHNENKIIGGVKHLAEDSRGVIYESKLADTPLARETYELARLGVLGTSYGYKATQIGYRTYKGQKVRQLLAVTVYELSGVTHPANPYTTANAKASPFVLPMHTFPDFPPDRWFYQEIEEWLQEAEQERKARELWRRGEAFFTKARRV